MPRSKAPSLVDSRRKEWGVPEVTFAPVDDFVIVWRLPPLTTTASGLLTIPEDARNPHIKGLLLKMGPRARDILHSNGIEEGHIVVWLRYAGSEMHDHTDKKRMAYEIILLRARDIVGSDDLQKELAGGKAKYVKGEDGRHRLQRQLPSGKVQKMLALAASTTGPESDTARSIAAEFQRKGA